MNLYDILPWLVAGITLAIALAYLLYYINTKRASPTKEAPISPSFRIEINSKERIYTYKGTLYPHSDLLNSRNAFILKKSLGIKEAEDFINDCKKHNCHTYAMRHGLTKFAFISVEHPIEIKPYYLSEEETREKVVHATGVIGKEADGWVYVIMTPNDQIANTLTPKDYSWMENLGDVARLIREKAPLQEEVDALNEKCRVLGSKVDGIDVEIGGLTDKAGYWQRLAMKKEEVTEAGEGLKIPKWIRTLIPYGISALIGYGIGIVLGQSSPDIAQVHPLIFSVGALILVWIIKKLK